MAPIRRNQRQLGGHAVDRCDRSVLRDPRPTRHGVNLHNVDIAPAVTMVDVTLVAVRRACR